MSRLRGTLRKRLPALVVTAGLLSLLGCGPPAPRPSVLIITVDTLRADAVSAWGAETATTPHLDALATRGVSFLQATTVTPLTLPAHASLFTGARPARHGLSVNGLAPAEFPAASLTERFAAQGYETAAFVSAVVLDRRHGLAPGFAVYDDQLAVPGGPPAALERRGDHTVDAALRWSGFAEPAFFAWVHLFDPHAPYAAPGAASGTDRAAYLQEVRFADQQIGRLLEGVQAQASGPVLVLVTSDHGEGLGEHGEETHGLQLYESTLHIPLLVAWLGAPGRLALPEAEAALRAGSRRQDVVSILDVAPSLLSALDLQPLSAVDGASFWTPQPGRALPLETRVPWFYYGFSPLIGVRCDTLKLVGAEASAPPAWTLFDLAQDPAELRAAPGDQHALQTRVLSSQPTRASRSTGDADTLSALGYGGAVPPPQGLRPPRDPRAEMPLIRALDRAQSALAANRPDDALAALPEREDEGEIPELLLLRAQALAALHRDLEALSLLRRATALRPTAALLLEQGRLELQAAEAGVEAVTRAAETLDRALQLDARDPRTIALRASAELLLGQAEQARQRLAAALLERPEHLELLTVSWRAHRALGLTAEAEQLAARLRQLWPEHPELGPVTPGGG
ncbi:MAG: sulfatase-like hydrolase/transferase [Planctomycetota bacterium]